LSTFQFEWWTVEVRECTGRITWEVKAKNKENAIKQIQKMAKDHNKEIQRMRPDFETEIFWNTLTLDRKGYQRLF
jgi:hypothetical protein